MMKKILKTKYMAKPILIIRTSHSAAEINGIMKGQSLNEDYHVMIVHDDMVDELECEIVSELTQCAKNSNHECDMMGDVEEICINHEAHN